MTHPELVALAAVLFIAVLILDNRHVRWRD
jgi:hypothetical protein